MVFVPVANVAQVNLKIRAPNGQTLEQISYWLRSAGYTAIALADLLLKVAQAWDSTIKQTTQNGHSLYSVVGRDLTTQNGLVDELPVSPVDPGALAQASLPSNVNWCIKFVTGQAGRSFRGRVFVYGLGEQQVDGDFVTPASATAIFDNWVQFYAAVEQNAGVTHVVVSRYANGQPRAQGIATPVQAYAFTDTRVDTQRRRLFKATT